MYKHCIIIIVTLMLLLVGLCSDGDVRLVGGKDEIEGRVEMCKENVWGSICDDSWDVHDGGVVCQQLGYHGTSNSQ